MHSFARHGVYTATLAVQDDNGAWSPAVSYIVTVNDTLPSVRLKADRKPGGGPGEFVFSAAGTSDIDDPAENLTYRWDFGDGSTADGTNATHSYRAAGNYIVTLTVEDGSGGTVSRSVMVNVPGGSGEQAGWMTQAMLAAAAVIAASAAGIVFVRRRRPGKKPVPRQRPNAIIRPKGPKNGPG